MEGNGDEIGEARVPVDGNAPGPCLPMVRWFAAREGGLTDAEIRHLEKCPTCQSRQAVFERVRAIPDRDLLPRLHAAGPPATGCGRPAEPKAPDHEQESRNGNASHP
jgi:hypothetical protein